MFSMDKLEGFLAEKSLRQMLSRNTDRDCKRALIWVLAIIGSIAAIAVIAYVVYRFATPDYLEDFDEDFDDDFEDYFNEEKEA